MEMTTNKVKGLGYRYLKLKMQVGCSFYYILLLSEVSSYFCMDIVSRAELYKVIGSSFRVQCP